MWHSDFAMFRKIYMHSWLCFIWMSVLQMNSEISGWICHAAAAALAERTAERIRWVRRGGRRKKRFSLLFKAGEWVSGWFTESCNYPVEITHSVQCGVAASFIFLALWCARKTAPLSLSPTTQNTFIHQQQHTSPAAQLLWRCWLTAASALWKSARGM